MLFAQKILILKFLNLFFGQKKHRGEEIFHLWNYVSRFEFREP
jgi:hypothetical protein